MGEQPPPLGLAPQHWDEDAEGFVLLWPCQHEIPFPGRCQAAPGWEGTGLQPWRHRGQGGRRQLLEGPALPCTQSTWMSPLPYSLKPALVLLVVLWVGIFIPQRLPRREQKLPGSPSSLANLRAAAFKGLPGLAELSQRCVCSGTEICSPIAFAARINDHGEERGCLTWLSEGESEQKWLALGKEGK